MDDLVAGTQLRNHIETLDRGTKDGVTGIEVMLGTQAEVELRTRGIGSMERAMARAPSTWLLRGLVANSPLMQ